MPNSNISVIMWCECGVAAGVIQSVHLSSCEHPHAPPPPPPPSLSSSWSIITVIIIIIINYTHLCLCAVDCLSGWIWMYYRYIVIYYILLQKLTSVSQWHFPRESEEAAAAGNGSRGRQRCWRPVPRHHMGIHLVFVNLPDDMAVAPPGLVLRHPAAVQRLLQAYQQLRGRATEGHPAAQDLRWKHDRNEAGVWMIETTRHECCMEITNMNISILPAQLAFLNKAHYFQYSVWTYIG